MLIVEITKAAFKEAEIKAGIYTLLIWTAGRAT